jgi:hypothetical protein
MRCAGPARTGGLLAITMFVLEGAAQARPALMVTAGGGLGGIYQHEVCIDGGTCVARKGTGWSALIGAGLFDVSESGVRGALRLEGALSFGPGRGHQANVLGVVGWQGERLVLEAGMGSSALGSVTGDSTRWGLGGLFHAGAGFRLTPALTVLARGDAIKSQDMNATFLGLTLEWLALR